ncbi:MAG: hypothetical protein WC803_01145 [Sphingomonas sp.]
MLNILAQADVGVPGARLHGVAGLWPIIAAGGAIGALANLVASHSVRPVRALLFDKSARANWALGWHQDRTIAVAERRDMGGFGPWTVKSGVIHVEPPFALIEQMVTLRVHLDPVDSNSAAARSARFAPPWANY